MLIGLAVVTLAAILRVYQLVLEFGIIEDACHADRFPAPLQLFLLVNEVKHVVAVRKPHKMAPEYTQSREVRIIKRSTVVKTEYASPVQLL